MNRSFGNMSRLTTQTPGTEWEDLRKQACQYENEIETKLTSFSKLCSNYSAHEQNDSPTTTKSSIETISIDIDNLLERLTDITKRMSDILPSLHSPGSPATHTVQRHFEILQDYRREYERTKSNLRNLQRREDLLLHTNPDLNSSSSTTTASHLNSRRQDFYLREMTHLNNSHKLMDTNLDMAALIRKDLADQKKHFLTISNKINSLANRFPLVNNVLQKIKMKKRKDSLVLGCVIAVCFIILLLYSLR